MKIIAYIWYYYVDTHIHFHFSRKIEKRNRLDSISLFIAHSRGVEEQKNDYFVFLIEMCVRIIIMLNKKILYIICSSLSLCVPFKNAFLHTNEFYSILFTFLPALHSPFSYGNAMKQSIQMLFMHSCQRWKYASICGIYLYTNSITMQT